MSRTRDIEDLLRDAAPRVLAAVVRRFGDFADAEDATQEAMLAATQQWPRQGTPRNPVGWLIYVASLRVIDRARSDSSRRDREAAAAARAVAGLATAEIAAAFLVPEATMAQRISRAKRTIKASGIAFRRPTNEEWVARMRSVLHIST